MKPYIILAVIFVLFSCDKDEKPDPIHNQNHCQILSYGANNFMYDNDGNLIKIEGMIIGRAEFIKTFDYSSIDQNVIKVHTLYSWFDGDQSSTNM